MFFSAGSYAGWIEVADHDINSGTRDENGIEFITTIAPLKIDIWVRTKIAPLHPNPVHAKMEFDAYYNNQLVGSGIVERYSPGTKSQTFTFEAVDEIRWWMDLDVIGIGYARAKLYYAYL